MKEKNSKDYYVKIMLYQIFFSFFIVAVVFVFFKNNSEFKNNFFEIINSNIEGVELETVVESFRSQLYDLKNLNNSTDITEGAGGKDLTFREAAENTSFAPIFATAKICPPIEEGRYTSYFGYRINPVTGEYGFHTGVDIAAAEGTKIRAAFNGRVVRVGVGEQTGKYILIEHSDGFSTFYCHCSEITVNSGAVVRQGETVAFVGSTGYSTGPHLHFEVRKGKVKYNPMWLLKD